jgi:hypothetical protein
MSHPSGGRAAIGRVTVEARVARRPAREAVAAAPPAESVRAKPIDARACDERHLASALADLHGVPAVDLSRSVIDLVALARVPYEVADADAILPLATDGRRLHLAIATPGASGRVAAEVRLVTGLDVSVYVAVLGALRDAIAGAYAAAAGGAASWRGAAAPPGSPPGLAVVEPARS